MLAGIIDMVLMVITVCYIIAQGFNSDINDKITDISKFKYNFLDSF